MRKKANRIMAFVLSAVMLVPMAPGTTLAAVQNKAEEAAESLTLPYNTTDKQVYGNITLPSVSGDDVAVTWKTSNPEIVDVKEYENEGYDPTPAGTVTRPEKDTDVTMTATLSADGKTVTKDFIFTVKAAPEEKTEDDYTDYFFAYFAGEGYSNGEQIYFAASRDGLNWKDLNENEPVLTSTLGEKGVRDPFIIRSHEGDKFYMIATDLKINNGNGWSAAQTAGSQSIMVWESTDLVNWSEQRMVPISESIDSGCTWAPEAYYDDMTGEYIVFWASKVKADNYSKQRLYYAKTRDFYSFSEPEVYIEMDQSSIDTTMMYDEETGKYYRYTKNEGGSTNSFGAKSKTVYAETSDTLLGEWSFIESDTLNSNGGVEGPSIFKFNKDDQENGDYCLLVDNYGSGGYYPLVTNDIASAVYTRPSVGYKMPSRARHGTPIQITAEEYQVVMEKWGSEVAENNEPEQISPKLSYTFEDVEGTNITDDSGNDHDGKLYGNAKVVYDEEKDSNVLYLNGSTNTYASMPTGFFDGRNKFTLTMDVKAANVSGNFFTFTFGKSDSKYYFLKTMQDSIKSVISTNSWNAEYGFSGQKVNTTILNHWINVTIVVDNNVSRMYVDGNKVGENTSVATLVTELGKDLEAYLGKSFYSADAYFNGYFDNVKVYNRVLTDEEILNGEEKEADKTALNAAISAAIPETDADKYTKVSWDAYQEALSEAKKVAVDADVSQDTVDKAAKALEDAKALLKEETVEIPYKDVDKDAWFYDAVLYTYKNGIMTGIDKENFGPYVSLSRAQFALILYRMEGSPKVETTKSFKDVVGDEWFADAVLWAAEKNIVTGYTTGASAGCFGPADLITREQMAVMMFRYAKTLGKNVSTESSYESYKDAADVSPFASDAIKWAIGSGIITGKESGTKIDPQGNTARSEAALIIQRYMER